MRHFAMLAALIGMLALSAFPATDAAWSTSLAFCSDNIRASRTDNISALRADSISLSELAQRSAAEHDCEEWGRICAE